MSQTMRKPILSCTNPSEMMSTPIRSELQITLVPPCYPEINFKKYSYRTGPFSTKINTIYPHFGFIE